MSLSDLEAQIDLLKQGLRSTYIWKVEEKKALEEALLTLTSKIGKIADRIKEAPHTADSFVFFNNEIRMWDKMSNFMKFVQRFGLREGVDYEVLKEGVIYTGNVREHEVNTQWYLDDSVAPPNFIRFDQLRSSEPPIKGADARASSIGIVDGKLRVELNRTGSLNLARSTEDDHGFWGPALPVYPFNSSRWASDAGIYDIYPFLPKGTVFTGLDSQGGDYLDGQSFRIPVLKRKETGHQTCSVIVEDMPWRIPDKYQTPAAVPKASLQPFTFGEAIPLPKPKHLSCVFIRFLQDMTLPRI